MLTDIAIRRAKPLDAPYKLADAGGLYLLVSTKGARSWRMKYRHGGKERLLTFGLYPTVSLTEARARRDEAKLQLRNGLDPSAERRRQPQQVVPAPTFEEVARDWHNLHSPKWNVRHGPHVLRELEKDVFPSLGAKDITQISAPMVLATLRQIEARGAIDTARRLRQRVSAVFVFGIASGICVDDPAAIVARAMAPMKIAGRRPAVTELAEVQAILVAVHDAKAMPITKLAMHLLALTAVRPGEVVGAEWKEFEDLEGNAPIWRIPKERMKGELGSQYEHIVPLSLQAIATVNQIKALTGNRAHLFPNRRDARKPMTSDALSGLLKRCGYEGKHVPHGWRSTFSTLMNEEAERTGRASDRAIIDLMLAHAPNDGVEKIYNRSAYLPRRFEIAQAWGDMLCPDSRHGS